MLASNVADVVGPGKEISHKDTRRPSQAVGCRDGSLAGAGAGTPNYDAAGGESREKRQLWRYRHGRKCSQLDMPPAEPRGRRIQKSGREDVRFLEAEQLGAQ